MGSKSSPQAGSFDTATGQSFLNQFYQDYFNDLSIAVKSTLDRTLLSWFEIKPLKFNKEINSTSLSGYDYSFAFGFEHGFETTEYVEEHKSWMARNWKSSFAISAVYILLILVGRNVMKNRPRYELRTPLILWNLMLATFSIFGAIRAWPEFYNSIFNRGIVYSVCSDNYGYGVSGYWAYLFIMSKLPELVDTLFIVLRKQELIFLHYYHHASVLIYCWYSYHHFAASGRWFMNMNYLVHSLMYSYYALKAMKINVPKQVALLITTGQIAQMIFGCYVNYVAYQTKRSGKACKITDENIQSSFVMYLSYFVLFAHFFANSYIFGKKNKPARDTAKTNGVKAVNGQASGVKSAAGNSKQPSSSSSSSLSNGTTKRREN